MKTNDLLEVMRVNKVSLPLTGTGRGGRIINRDLEDALGDHFQSLLPDLEREHMELRRLIRPMKAMLYGKVPPAQQTEMLADETKWVAEEKFDGWRMLITSIPDKGIRIYGGNISTTDFMPVDYTEHIDLQLYDLKTYSLEPFIIDAEALCYESVNNLDGFPSQNTREAVANILSSGVTNALKLQENGANIIFKCFDLIKPWYLDHEDNTASCPDLNMRKCTLVGLVSNLGYRFKFVKSRRSNKKDFLRKIWKSGGEGIVLKNQNSLYLSNGRHKDYAVKLKRNLSGEIGDNIDAFVTGFVLTKEWSKKNLIGGLEMSVIINDAWVKIATITAMSDVMRRELTFQGADGAPELVATAYHRVLEIDGQELSSRNRQLMHARANWTRGFRKTKTHQECVMEAQEIEEERF